ncbi:MAG: hypothetical protein AB4038_22695 [Prochloraceae cyanobacterium]
MSEVSSAQLKESKNSTLAILFFAFGALHIYGAMRSPTRRGKLVQHQQKSLMPSVKLAQKRMVLSSSPKMSLGLTVSLLAVVVVEIIEILRF